MRTERHLAIVDSPDHHGVRNALARGYLAHRRWHDMDGKQVRIAIMLLEGASLEACRAEEVRLGIAIDGEGQPSG